MSIATSYTNIRIDLGHLTRRGEIDFDPAHFQACIKEFGRAKSPTASSRLLLTLSEGNQYVPSGIFPTDTETRDASESYRDHIEELFPKVSAPFRPHIRIFKRYESTFIILGTQVYNAQSTRSNPYPFPILSFSVTGIKVRA